MFLSLAKLFSPVDDSLRANVFLVHPLQLSRWLDEAWAAQGLVPPLPSSSANQPFLGDPAIVGLLDLPNQPAGLVLPSGIDLADTDKWSPVSGPTSTATGVGLLWHHLVYAYLIESTGAFEVLAEVVRRLVIGETLGPLGGDSTKWLRATEELFLRDPPLFSISGVVSEARPYARLSRRNAYWRMFGLDLPHAVPARWGGSGGEQAWKADTGAGVNTDFRAKWTELLRQVWLGRENAQNTSGANTSDAAYVALLCEAIKDMLNNRRRGGLLAREEFTYVTVLSWFHLTLQGNTPIVRDLKAEATSPADRLAMIAQRVGMTPAARSRELFELAEPMSTLLRAIELGFFDTSVNAATLFLGNTALATEMSNIVNLWQSATGDRVKERATGTVVMPSLQPLRIPSPSPAPAGVPVGAGASTNGSAR